MLVICIGAIAGAACAQNNQGTGYIIGFSNSASASGQFEGFSYSSQPLGPPVFSTTGPGGADQIIAKPDGSKFFVVGSGGVYDFNPAFTTSVVIKGILGSVTRAVISPDGQFLLISSNLGSGSSSVYVVNTTTDAIVLIQPVSGAVIGMAVSRDSTTAWVLGESIQPFITILSLTVQQELGSPVFLRDPVTGNSLAADPQFLALSPLGLLYVSAANQILEINPSTLENAAPSIVAIAVNATAGPLQFSADGATAYFVNESPQIGGVSLLRMALPSHAITIFKSAELFDSIILASPTHLFAHSPGDTTLWDVAADLSSITVSALASILPATQILSIAASDELPAARYLYALAGSGTQPSLYRVDLTNDTLSGLASAASGVGALQFVIVPPETNPVGFIDYNATQIVPAGATAAPLIARVLDQSGNALFAVPAKFSGDPSLTIQPASTTTNADGYAITTVTVGTTPGSYPVTLAAGTGANAVTTTFVLTVPGTGTGSPPPAPPVGTAQIIIAGGNGQFIRTGQPSGVPLTVQVLQADGNPMTGVPVTFAVGVGQNTGASIGQLDNTNAITDANGFASTDFVSPFLAAGEPIAFDSATVSASASVGSVNFVETVFQEAKNGGAPPVFSLVAPVTQPITIGEGDVIPNGIIASISTTYEGVQPVPNVGLRLASGTDSSQPGAASCQGTSLSDANGLAHCNVIASCQTTFGLTGISVVVGEYYITPVSLNVTAGSSRNLVIKSGNNQSGSAGNALPLPLVATVSDNCGTVVSGVSVAWTVTQGSATLKNVFSASDSDGDVSTSVVLGETPGVVQVTASINGSVSVVFTLTASTTATTITSGGIVPVGSTVNTIQPGEWVSIYGFNLASVPANWNGNFPTSLGGTSVTIDGRPAYLSFVSPMQINLQAPDDTATGPVPVVVTGANGTATSSVILAEFAPSFLLLDNKHVAGIILRPNGSGAYGGGTYDIIGPTGTSLGYATVAAKAGDIVELFAVGLGPTNPTVPAGQAFSATAPTTNAVNILINGVSVTPTFAGLSSAGVYQINLTLPAGLGAGDLSLAAEVGGAQTPSGVVISLQNATGSGPLIQSLTLTPNSVVSGGSVTGSVELSAAAPSGGAVVALSSGSSAVVVPATVTVPSGATSATFTISTGTVSSSQTVTITASYGGSFAQASLTVTPPTSSIQIVSGNNQTASVGQPFSAPLVVAVVDPNGNPVSGVTVSFAVTQGSATLSVVSAATNVRGQVSVTATAGAVAGTIAIKASYASMSVTFTLTANATVGSMRLLSGGGQTAIVGSAFSQPIVFQLTDVSGNPIAGVAVIFSVTGSASLSSSSAITNAQGQVSVVVTAGNTPGSVTITASYATFAASASLTVIAPGPSVTSSSFVNAASGQPGLVPCGLTTVTGSGLAPGVVGVVSGNIGQSGPLPYALAGVSITVSGVPAPLESVSNQSGIQQVNFQTPCEIVSGALATVVVQVGAASTTVVGVTVYPAQPGIFTFAGPAGINYGYVGASNGTILTPSNLAHAGQAYYLVATGLGQTSPAAVTNSPGTGAQTIPAANVVLAIDNIGVAVTSVQYQQGAIGNYVINFTIPVTVNGMPFPTGTNLPITLGVIVNSQTFFDISSVSLPGID